MIEHIRHIKTSGTIVGSSPFLVSRMLRAIDFARARTIVQLGVGTGCITRGLLRRMRPDARLISLELNQVFVEENREIWTADFKEELRELMREAITLEKEFIRDCLPVNAVGLAADEFLTYIDYIADRRLEGCGLAPLAAGVKNPLPWLAEMMDIKKEQNFFEGRVTEYQKASAPNAAADDDL